jgi:membrane fusion protein, heavy metal efflux system
MRASACCTPLLAALCGCMGATEQPRVSSSSPGEVWLTPQQVQQMKLVIEPVREEDVDGAVEVSGKVTFDDLRVAHIFSPVTGRVVRIVAQPGQRVKLGAALAVIESPDVGSAFADLGKAQADMIAARHEFRRQSELYQAHAGAQRDLEAARDNFEKAKAEIDRARQKARLFRSGKVNRVTQHYTLQAPIAGEVIARNINPGAEVQGQYSGANAVELFTVGEIDNVWVVADVFEMDLARVRQGATVAVRVVSYPHLVYEGRVDWVAPTLDAATRTAKVRCAIANPRRELKPEMYATVSIIVAERRALAVARGAVMHLGDQTSVLVEAGQSGGRIRFERRPVYVEEEEGGEHLPVTHGLRRGERVVSSGAILLSGMLQ